MTQTNVRHRVTSPSKVHDTTTSTHPPTQKCRPGTPQCTPQQTTNKNKKVHWHTIEFSHNTRTPNQPRHKSQPIKGGTSGSFPVRHLTRTHSGGALSVSLTHTKLHTPTTKHKPPGKTGF